MESSLERHGRGEEAAAAYGRAAQQPRAAGVDTRIAARLAAIYRRESPSRE